MPRLKKEAAKKPAAKKPRVKRVVQKEKIALKPKSKDITIDIIADDEEVLFSEPLTPLPADNPSEREQLDVQKKYFSDLVTDMKQKKDGVSIKADSRAAAESNRPVNRKSLSLYRRIAYQFIGLTLLLLLVVAYFFLPSLKITMYPNAEAIADSLSLRIASADSEDEIAESAGSRLVAGEVRTIALSAEKVFESSGEEILGEEVVGEVILHNEYTKPQPLVAKTRLLSVDNKLFRLKEAVNIPAGGTVKAEVYADQPSLDMAVGPTKFTIPGLWLGLQDKIYATSETPFEYQHQVKRYIKQRDLDQAIVGIKKALSEKAEAALAEVQGGDYAVAYNLDDSAAVVKIDVKLGDEIGEFVVSAENTLAIAMFSKEQAEALVKAKIAFLLPDDKRLSAFNGNDIAYRLDAYDAASSTATVVANFKGNMTLRTDANIIDRKQLVNLNEEQISEYLRAFPEISSYDLDFFPKFIKRAPSLADRIKVEVIQ